MKLGIIGTGAIGSYVRDKAIERGHTVAALLLKPERLQNPGTLAGQFNCVSNIADLPGDIDVMLDCAGHAALQSLGPAILRNGVDLITARLERVARRTSA